VFSLKCLTGIRPPKYGKTLPHFRSRAWRCQSVCLILENELRRIAGERSRHKNYLRPRFHVQNQTHCLAGQRPGLVE
jgi:hypothetical protein